MHSGAEAGSRTWDAAIFTSGLTAFSVSRILADKEIRVMVCRVVAKDLRWMIVDASSLTSSQLSQDLRRGWLRLSYESMLVDGQKRGRGLDPVIVNES